MIRIAADAGVHMINDRQKTILAEVTEKEYASVPYLIERFEVSAATIRRDIAILEKENKVKRVRNGVKKKHSISTLNQDISQTFNYNEKMAIAMYAASLIDKLDTASSVFISGGTTLLMVGQNIKNDTIDIHTDYLPLLIVLVEKEHKNIFSLGGKFSQDSTSFLQPVDEDNLPNIDLFITSVNSVDIDGMNKRNPINVMVERAVMKKANKVIVLATSDKFNKKTGFHFCNLDEIDQLITDTSPSTEIQKRLRESDVDLIVVKGFGDQ